MYVGKIRIDPQNKLYENSTIIKIQFYRALFAVT